MDPEKIKTKPIIDDEVRPENDFNIPTFSSS